jgi:membrane protease YdiL (CAAX protease family)
MEAMPPRLEETQPVSRWRWWVHLLLVTLYLVGLTLLGLERHKIIRPALTHTVRGLLTVCGVELVLFGLVIGAAWLASRASLDDLLLRWRGKAMPVVWGAAYSLGLRLALAFLAVAAVVVLLATRAATLDSLQNFALNKRPGVEKMVDVQAMRDNPAYYWLTLTLVSFVVAGVREELWRSSFLAGMKNLWPRQFGSTPGQIQAVVIAAVIFGAAHLSMGILAAVMAGVLGLGLGLIMVLHRSIWPAVFAHGFFDCASMAFIPWALELMHHLPGQ